DDGVAGPSGNRFPTQDRRARMRPHLDDVAVGLHPNQWTARRGIRAPARDHGQRVRCAALRERRGAGPDPARRLAGGHAPEPTCLEPVGGPARSARPDLPQGNGRRPPGRPACRHGRGPRPAPAERPHSRRHHSGHARGTNDGRRAAASRPNTLAGHQRRAGNEL
ncbi:MAG: hypothetical protein AVDCRST_MAG87-2067, partial [uncultured Thermomicrobiales bacterium]